MKILFFILDGLGDRPIKEFGNKTPLEAAETPNFDFLAKEGMCGLIKSVYADAFPTSVEGHLSLFGYDIRKWKTTRGVFEAIGAGMKVKKGDVALRGNFATVDKNFKIIDRRAGRIPDTSRLVKALQGINIEGVKFLLADSISHRVVIVMRGRGLSDEVSDGDFHKVGIRAPKILPYVKTKKAEFSAYVLNKFLQKAHQVLERHSLNKQRLKKGLLPANYILVREAGMLQQIPSFQRKWGQKACCIAGGKLYQAIGKVLKMDFVKVRGSTGKANTNIEGKFKAAKRALGKYDFCYLHIKAVDNFGHDGDCKGKKAFIEKIDKYLPILFGSENTLLIVTGDHSTPCEIKEHSPDDLPVLVYGGGKDGVSEFSEKACKKGALGKMKSVDFLKTIC